MSEPTATVSEPTAAVPDPTATTPEAAATARAPAPTAPARVNPGDLLSAVGAAVLLVLMFGFAWYGVDGIPARGSVGAGIAGAENAWHGLTLLRWVMLLTILVTLGSVAIHAGRPSRHQVAGARLAVLVLGCLTAALVGFRVLVVLPSPERVVDQKLGAILGVLSTLAIALGGYESVREQRERSLALIGLTRSRNRPASDRPGR